MGESREEPSDIDHVENMDKKRLFLYSSHDTQISVTLQALGQFNMLAPPYGSSIVFELHEMERVRGREVNRFGSDSDSIQSGSGSDSNSIPSGSGSDSDSTPDGSVNGNRFYMKAFYWNETQKSHMVPLTLPGCEGIDSCSAERFIQSMSEYIPLDWSSECSLSILDQINSGNTNHYSDSHIGLAVDTPNTLTDDSEPRKTKKSEL